MTPVNTEMRPAKAASTIALLAGAWLFVSPWVYGVSSSPGTINSWIIGALIFLFAIIRLSQPASTGASWVNTILGIWTFASPWIFGYTYVTGRFINSLCVGVVVFFAALSSANAMPHGTQPTPRRM